LEPVQINYAILTITDYQQLINSITKKNTNANINNINTELINFLTKVRSEKYQKLTSQFMKIPVNPNNSAMMTQKISNMFLILNNKKT
jgi:hypothetical protein